MTNHVAVWSLTIYCISNVKKPLNISQTLLKCIPQRTIFGISHKKIFRFLWCSGVLFFSLLTSRNESLKIISYVTRSRLLINYRHFRGKYCSHLYGISKKSMLFKRNCCNKQTLACHSKMDEASSSKTSVTSCQ